MIAVRREKYSIFVVDGDTGFADELGRRILERSDMDLCGKAPKVGRHSAASSTPNRPDVPQPQ